MLEVVATIRLEMIIKTVKPSNTNRRSTARVRLAVNNPDSIAATAVTATACPTTASETPVSAAIGVRRVAGRYSAVRSPKTPRVNDSTAAHFAGVLSGSAGLGIVLHTSLLNCRPSPEAREYCQSQQGECPRYVS